MPDNWNLEDFNGLIAFFMTWSIEPSLSWETLTRGQEFNDLEKLCFIIYHNCMYRYAQS